MTAFHGSVDVDLPYHTKSCQGTMTKVYLIKRGAGTIPYQELSGNYDSIDTLLAALETIPYQELSGNYDFAALSIQVHPTIPYQELSGNYGTENYNQTQVAFYHCSP